MISKEVIQALFDRPLPTAARNVGLSATAFKQACRKLGIARWPYNALLAQAPSQADTDVSNRNEKQQGAAETMLQTYSSSRALSSETEAELAEFFEGQFGAALNANVDASSQWRLLPLWLDAFNDDEAAVGQNAIAQGSKDEAQQEASPRL